MRHRAWIESLAGKLVDWQEDTGAWSYPGLIVDLSNTQYAALGLWAAAKAGVDVAPEVWRQLALGTLEYQDESGGFSYTAPGKGATGSMTTAGVGILALCEIELALAGALDGLEESISNARAKGVAWLAANFAVDTNPRSGAHHYYYLYGLERMAALAGLARVGTHDWYAEGAGFLVGAQDEQGSWESGTDPAQTCFGLLFLERATAADRRGRAPETGAEAHRRARATEQRDAPIRIAVTVEHGVTRAWIASWNPEAVAELEWPEETGRGPRVRRVEYLVDGRLAAVTLGVPERPAGSERFAAFLRTGEGGPAEIIARVVTAMPGGGETSTLESPSLAVELPAGVAALRRPARGDDLLGRGKARAKGSSTISKRDRTLPKGDFEPERAIDGRPGTPWIASRDDDEPTLKLTLRKKQRVAFVVLVPPDLPGHDAGLVVPPAAVRVIVNGKKNEAVDAELRPGATGSVRIDLGGVRNVQRIDLVLRAPEGAHGPDHPPIGLGEVELHGPEAGSKGGR